MNEFCIKSIRIPIAIVQRKAVDFYFSRLVGSGDKSSMLMELRSKVGVPRGPVSWATEAGFCTEPPPGQLVCMCVSAGGESWEGAGRNLFVPLENYLVLLLALPPSRSGWVGAICRTQLFSVITMIGTQ